MKPHKALIIRTIQSQKVLTDTFNSIIDHIAVIWDKKVEITIKKTCNNQITYNAVPDDWKRLISLIMEEYNNYDSFVILHHGDTLAYTSAALSFGIANSSKPIVLTEYQEHSVLAGDTNRINIINSIKVAVWPYDPNISGVVIVAGSSLVSGVRGKKLDASGFDSFISFLAPTIGHIGAKLTLNEAVLREHNGYLTGEIYNPALETEDLIVNSIFEHRMAVINEFPGMSPKIITSLADSDIKGIILRTFGAGDPAAKLYPALEFCREKEIPVIAPTQAVWGSSNMQANEPGQYVLKHGLAIPTFDMNFETAFVKLSWLLGQKSTGEMSYRSISRKMTDNYRGEITTMQELRQ